MKRSAFRLFRWTLLAAVVLLLPAGTRAHSGKARFHMVIDTDGAADDLRTLCMLLGNREAEVLAVTTSEGALTPAQAAARVAALLREFHHQGVPVGQGRAVGAAAPPWRAHSASICWGDSLAVPKHFPAARELLAQTCDNEQERIVFVALGALTNLHDLLQTRPDLALRIEQVVWYGSLPGQPQDANWKTDPEAARSVLASGIPVHVVSAGPDRSVPITNELLSSVSAVPTRYARKIVRTHRTAPLDGLVARGHLQAWDDLAALFLYAPELFTKLEVTPTVRACTLVDDTPTEEVEAVMLSILRGKPDAESRVFYGFPVGHDLYADEVVAIIDEAIARHGPSEWRAGVLTNELHGHLGIYATVGVKMGIRAREYFNIGVDDILVTSYAGSEPPVSCMNDGLQVSTGATVGHGLIEVAAQGPVRPEARFSFKGKTIRIRLKPEYADRIRQDVQQGVALHGDQTEPYWQYIRELALRYWRDFDRYAIFDLYVEESTPERS